MFEPVQGSVRGSCPGNGGRRAVAWRVYTSANTAVVPQFARSGRQLGQRYCTRVPNACRSLRLRVPGEGHAAVAAVLFGSAYAATGVALEDFSPASIGAWRGLFSAALFVILVRASRTFRISVRDVRPGGWLRALLISSFGGPVFLL